MDNYEDLQFEQSDADSGDDAALRMYKSQLYQIAKCAQNMFEILDDERQLEGWMRSEILSCYDGIEKVYKYAEYDKAFPSKDAPSPPEVIEEEQKENNNYLTNEDKRYPVPQGAETGDGFVGRCIEDPNMKNRYPEQSDRFMACMLIWNDAPSNEEDNPGKKFEDPMRSQEPMPEPDRPILP
jgi:hypothetical protein